MTTRRSNTVNGEMPSSPSKPTTRLQPPGASSTSPSVSSPWLPTPLECALLATYPATLVLGSLFSVFNSSARNAPYSATLQSHPPNLAPSYFAKKSNIFNVFFVKVGWFWMTTAFCAFIFSHSSLGPRFSFTLTPRRLRAILRYLLVTSVWCAVTQWFFGAPLIDRGFRFTGGQCEIIYSDTPGANRKQAAMSDTREIFTHAACKTIGGTWKGGHDISGHVFILILGSAMLWLEILPAVLRASGLREDRRIRMLDGAVKSAAVETRDSIGNMPVPDSQDLGLGVKIAVGVAAMSWWMLLMTAAFFHTWFEKFTGLLVAFTAVYGVYFAPRAIPALREVIGMPGV
ncbi:hypothetical protein AAFC00_004594 [Neodothiora populina]|uniref:Acyl-coenzyme A diphosphatase SCS3 n=1 Tax=Neodothiora populina TaxID=2781224 RepID=A0ABR3P2I8_9PEZI